MAKLDYDAFPESARQSLLAASDKLALELFQDPSVCAEYEIWLARREAAKQGESHAVSSDHC